MTATQPAIAPPRGARQRLRTSPILAALVLGGVALALFGIVAGVTQWRDRGMPAVAAAASPSTGSLARFESAVRDKPDDAAAWAALGAGYVDHARVNSDPSAYPKAERALDRSLALKPDGNWEALAAHGALAAGRHDFSTALRYSEQARALQPQSAFILAIIVDSLTELGRYPEAVDAAQAMVDLRPDLASYSRVSYQRELHGDIDGAIDAMEAAYRAASTPGDKSFALYYLGELEWHRGGIEAAQSHYAAAVRIDPTAMQAVAGLGKVAAARGDLDTAVDQYERAVDAFPDPSLLTELGNLYLLTGKRDLAETAFDKAARANAAQAAGGVHVDLEIAQFSADHHRDLDAGLAAARAEWARRESVHVADALAWQLHAHGANAEALVYANKALALGTPNPAFLYHRAEINRALGNHDAARADYAAVLELNPHFSFLHRAGEIEAAAR